MVSILIPTRKRYDIFIKLIQSLEKDYHNINNFEVLVAYDEDDIQPDISRPWLIYYQRPRSKNINNDYYNWLASKCKGDIIWCLNDDVVIHDDWQESILTNINPNKEQYGLTQNKNPHNNESYAEFPILTRKAYEKLGWFFPPEILTHGSDKALYDIALNNNWITSCPINIEHLRTMKSIYIHSSHEALEMDQARMLLDLGYTVTGQFDSGGKQRKKIKGVTDISVLPQPGQVILLHQIVDFHKAMHDYLNQGFTVILHAFGQGNPMQHNYVCHLCKQYANAYVVAYSNRTFADYNRCPKEKIRLIRFNKHLSDFHKWKGDWNCAYITCNSIQHRSGCQPGLLDMIRKEIPVILSGKFTDEVGGLGELSEAAMNNIRQHARVYLNLGTLPAPCTLTFTEAICAGMPMVCFNNGYNAEEGFPTYHEHELIPKLKYALQEPRQEMHEESMEYRKLFDVDTVNKQWRELIESI